jgi:acetyl-CoA C-acetyltransferase
MVDDGVYLVGLGMTPVGEHWELSLRHLALQAIQAARAEAGGLRPQLVYVANMLAPALSGQSHLGALVADFAGLRGAEAITVEAAGASGGAAVRQAFLALRSGLAATALVVGVEKVTDRGSGEVEAALATGKDADYEAVHGLTDTAQAALWMRRYLHEHAAPADALAGFSLTAHRNAVSNPRAMYRRAIQQQDYQRADMLSDPLNLYDAAPLADGAAAVMLARGDRLPTDLRHPPVRIAGSALSTGALALHDQVDPLSMPAAAESAARALQQAGLQPDDIQLFELHDRFSIQAALSLEAAGFAARGHGWRLAQNGAIGLQGRIPVTTLGGSKARGDAGGATGLYQLAEAALQLQGRAGENQVPGARAALAQCLGGAAATAATHVLLREGGRVESF